MNWRRNREGAERFAERRQRENDAPRLIALFPKLASLRIELEERRAGGSLAETAHVRPVVVSSAPALFFFPCHDSGCSGGGHDVTSEITSFLRGGGQRLEGEDQCRGQTGTAECGRSLRYIVTATYQP